MAAAIPAEERLMNLVVALMATDIGLTKAQVLENVSGYRQRGAGNIAALEKMFERDKDELRALGIPLDTIASPSDPNDLRQARYRIPKSEYHLPEDVEFTAAELAVLHLAGSVWSVESMSADAKSGLRKIRALGIDVDEPILGFAPRLTPQHPDFTLLHDAISGSRVVTFDYIKPGEIEPRARTVAPLALVEYEGRWHLFAVDEDAGVERTFLLARIVPGVTTGADAREGHARDQAGERALAGLRQLAERQQALIEVAPASEAAMRLARRATADGDRYLVPYVDLHVFADELASYGPEAKVLEPQVLVAAVVDRLRAVHRLHASTKGGGQE